jgi:tRNA A-37 threonylcarbamoyl transferase component Bud32
MKNKTTSRYVTKPSNTGLANSMLRSPKFILLIAVGLTSLTALCGWLFGVPALKLGLNHQHMEFATSFWLFYLTLFCAPLILGLKDNRVILLSRCALVVSLIFSFLILAQAAFNTSFIPSLTITVPSHPMGAGEGAAGPSYLAFNLLPIDIGFCLFVTSAAALFLTFWAENLPVVFQSLSLLTALPAFFLVVAYMFGEAEHIDVICAYQNCVKLQYLNYVCLLGVSSAMLFARPQKGLTSLISASSAGGRQVRLSLAGTALLLPVLGILFAAKHSGMINEPALIVLSLIAAFAMVISMVAYHARTIDKIDQEKQASELSLSDANAKLKTSIKYRLVCLDCFKEYPQGVTTCPDDNSPLARVAESLAPGAVLSDKYEIIEVLGFGGMSTVYRARHVFFDTIVAIKVLNQQLATETKSLQRFQAEAKAAHGLNHPNILAVADFGMSQEGQAYIVMDYLEGQSLADVIEEGLAMPLTQALPIFLDICRGLEHAHEHGVVHRDIKPGNVMLVKTADGKATAKIVDFGLAKVFDEQNQKLTQTGEVYGSPLYMSPEQCRGLNVDYKSDLYSLGVLMYETLSGRAPITGKTAYETFTKKLTDKPMPFDKNLAIPPSIENLVLDCLAIEPKARPNSAGNLERMLKPFAETSKAPN